MELNKRLIGAVGAGALMIGIVVGAATRGSDDPERVAATDATDPVPSTDTSEVPGTSTSSTPTSEAGGASSTTTPRATTTTSPAPAPPFEAAISEVTAVQLGLSWRPGCPVPPEDLRAIDASHWGYDNQVRRGRVIVHADQADRIVKALRDLYAARFPIQRMEPVDSYGADDQASMRANNTSAFNCRFVSGTSNWSEHAFGRAIDVNPLVNPYVKGSSVDPPEGAPYADRSRNDTGMIHADDAAVRAFAAQGWKWGGYWSGGKDYQHFSASGR